RDRNVTGVQTCALPISTCQQVMTVVDVTPPTLTCASNVAVECSALPPPVARATDDCDPNPSLTMTESRKDSPCPDNYTLTRTWTDRKSTRLNSSHVSIS